VASDARRVSEIYQRHARAWSRDRDHSLIEKAWLDRFLALLPRHPVVLDVGCGTGTPIARYLIECGCQVAGVDSSSNMITICADRFPRQQWLVTDMRALDLGRTFHGILAWDSLFHLPAADQRRMFPIFKQHAVPGAALMFTSGLAEGEEIGSCCGELLHHASLDSSEYLLHDNGFDVVTHVVEDPDCGLHTVWLATQVAEVELTSTPRP
jgi:SAM-dependent methyltransferase